MLHKFINQAPHRGRMSRTRGARNAPVQVKVAAVRLVNSGMAQRAVASAFGVAPSTVSRWRALARKGGLNALMRHPVAGRPRKLPERNLRRLLLRMGATPAAHGLPPGGWTTRRVAELIRREYGIVYHPSHVWKLLRAVVRK